MAAKALSPTEAFGKGQTLFFKHWKDVLKLFVVMVVVQFVFQFVTGMFGDEGMLMGLMQLAGNILSAYLGFGFFKSMFILYDGKSVELSDLAQPIAPAVRYVVGTFLMSLAVGIGMIFLVIPGLYLLTKYFFVPALLTDTDMSIGDAFAASSKMTAGRQMDMFLYVVLTVVAVIVGLLALIVGSFVASWIAMFGMIALYRSLVSKAK